MRVSMLIRTQVETKAPVKVHGAGGDWFVDSIVFKDAQLDHINCSKGGYPNLTEFMSFDPEHGFTDNTLPRVDNQKELDRVLDREGARIRVDAALQVLRFLGIKRNPAADLRAIVESNEEQLGREAVKKLLDALDKMEEQ